MWKGMILFSFKALLHDPTLLYVSKLDCPSEQILPKTEKAASHGSASAQNLWKIYNPNQQCC